MIRESTTVVDLKSGEAGLQNRFYGEIFSIAEEYLGEVMSHQYHGGVKVQEFPVIVQELEDTGSQSVAVQWKPDHFISVDINDLILPVWITEGKYKSGK